MDVKALPKGPVEEMSLAELHQELAESRNTIYQLRKDLEQFKRQRRARRLSEERAQTGVGPSQDQPAAEQQGPKTGVTGPA